MSTTSIEIDRDIADRAAKILGTTTLRDTVHASLVEIVNAERRLELVALLREPVRFDFDAAGTAWGADGSWCTCRSCWHVVVRDARLGRFPVTARSTPPTVTTVTSTFVDPHDRRSAFLTSKRPSQRSSATHEVTEEPEPKR